MTKPSLLSRIFRKRQKDAPPDTSTTPGEEPAPMAKQMPPRTPGGGGKGTVFRVSALRPETTVDDLNAALTSEFASEEEGVAVDTSRTTISQSCYGAKSRTALIQFRGAAPRALNALDGARSYAFEIGNTEVDIDKHFYGLTQLYPTPGKIVVE